jgi:DNA polymerase-3 subunit delta'
VWNDVVGQERAVSTLERAAEHPSHAYLLVGSRGSGVEDAARAFAARLIGAGDERSQKLVGRALHPDVVEFEPGGATYKVDDIRDVLLPEAHRAPVEGSRKVLIVFEAEKLCAPPAIAANALLKTLEEPPASTVVVLVTASADELLPTIRSRCQRVDFAPVSDASLCAQLERDGVPAELAALATALSGGQLARARALAGPIRGVRDAFAAVPARIDGTGARALALAEELDAAVDTAAAAVAQQHTAELEGFDAEMERYGYSDRDAQRMRKALAAKHQREARRARIDLLLEGVTAIESVYRDALVAPEPALNADRPPLALPARACGEAIDACREAREAFTINEKGLTRLVALLMALPPAAGA